MMVRGMIQESIPQTDFVSWNLIFLGSSVLGLFIYFVFMVRKRKRAGYRHEESESDKKPTPPTP